jgi:undecaprenyl-diphosphatase
MTTAAPPALFDRTLHFLRARLSPSGYAGLQLTAGIAALLLASALFGMLAEDVFTGDPIVQVDLSVAVWLHEHALAPLTSAMLVVTNVHSTLGVIILAVIFGAWLAWKRYWWWLLTLALTLPGGMLVNVLMKYAFHRARPNLENPLITLSTYSFPSGHTAGAMLFYGTLAAFAISRMAGWHGRAWTVVAAVAMAALVGFSRMYLGVHYLSDVIGAALESLAWLALCLTAVNTLRGRRAARTEPPVGPALPAGR